MSRKVTNTATLDSAEAITAQVETIEEAIAVMVADDASPEAIESAEAIIAAQVDGDSPEAIITTETDTAQVATVPAALSPDDRRNAASVAFADVVRRGAMSDPAEVARVVDLFANVPTPSRYVDEVSGVTLRSLDFSLPESGPIAGAMVAFTAAIHAALPAAKVTPSAVIESPAAIAARRSDALLTLQTTLAMITAQVETELDALLGLADDYVAESCELSAGLQKALAAIADVVPTIGTAKASSRGGTQDGAVSYAAKLRSQKSDYVDGATFHHAWAKRGTVSVLTIAGDVWTVNGEAIENKSPSGAARFDNGGTAIAGLTHWTTGAAPAADVVADEATETVPAGE